jgi:hypothetical protein
MRLDSTSVPDYSASLNFHKGTDKTTVADDTIVEIRRSDDNNIPPKRHINNASLPQLRSIRGLRSVVFALSGHD